jgi:hypothetical protein
MIKPPSRTFSTALSVARIPALHRQVASDCAGRIGLGISDGIVGLDKSVAGIVI